MPKHTAVRVVPYAQQRIFDAMMDIEKYPDVLRFIKSLKITDRTEDSLTARVAVGIGPLSFSYTCLITALPHSVIEVTAVKGPFKNLYAKWDFKPVSENETEVTCFLDAEFQSRMMEMAGGQIFAHQFQNAVAVFERYLKRQDRRKRNSSEKEIIS
tara:strand:- start:420 stop:887 length:468 start_codon:yes stop_codon:yes gene_type:complete